jgi:hypothetical protein
LNRRRIQSVRDLLRAKLPVQRSIPKTAPNGTARTRCLPTWSSRGYRLAAPTARALRIPTKWTSSFLLVLLRRKLKKGSCGISRGTRILTCPLYTWGNVMGTRLDQGSEPGAIYSPGPSPGFRKDESRLVQKQAQSRVLHKSGRRAIFCTSAFPQHFLIDFVLLTS